MNLNVHVVYRNSKMQPVADEFTPFKEYTTVIANDITKMITDVEDIIYTATGLSRDDWSDGVWAKFARLKHKMLDEAGAIRRLPENIVGGGTDGADLQRKTNESF